LVVAIGLVALLVVLGLGLIGVRALTANVQAVATPARNTQAATPVQTAPASTGAIRAVLGYAGTVQAAQQVNVAPKVPGVVQAIFVEVGTPVRKGDLIAMLDQATALAQVQQAQAGVQSAEARLTQIQTGARPEDVASARAQLAQAQARLAGLRGGRSEDVAAAQAQLDAARNRLNQLLNPLPSAVEAAQQGVTSAQAAYDAAVRSAATSSGQLLSLKATLERAEADLRAAQANYDRVRDLPNAGTLPQAVQLQQATIAYQQAKANYDSAASTVDSDSQAKIQTAAATLATAKDRLNALLNPSPADVAAAQQGVQAAEQALSRAQKPGAPEDIRQQEQLVVQMEAQLQLRAAPYTETDLKTAAAQLDQARAQLATAQAGLDQTVVTAPFDGVVAQKLLAIGAAASSATPIVTLITNGIELHTTVEESRVSLVGPGQPVALVAPAYPGVNFPAHVETIAPAADPRTHTFDVVIVPDQQDGRLKPGMFADVRITAQEKRDAVLVPREAVVQQGGGAVVFTVESGRAKANAVQTGLSDEARIEITQGIRAGDQVVVLGQTSLRDGQAVQVSSGPGGPAQPRPSGTASPGGAGQAQPGPGRESAPGTPSSGR
jgi:RND family efflux transporter MFP subunit